MKINFAQNLVNADGQPDETLCKVVRVALFAGQQSDRIELKKAEQCCELLSRIKPAVVDLSAEDIVLIKERVAAIYPSPGVVGQVSFILRGDSK